MRTTAPDSDGYIFFGVADRETHADRIETLDGIKKRKIAEHFLVGIEREAKILNISLDNYVKKVVFSIVFTHHSSFGQP